ncbi:hypothetical protein JAAARDRAFT_32856 [Jaapia argillacea MUCL 33604]|uniref:COP9 signalosome complex subunit 3 n=1 Tax=Jaapia argillacea MUCL 33604 TaxID=933084 RepID=A0A067QCZ1_9AGAM|nr:hypothetical protein JAAARDRAFT_32856 [Jaapia argillacea MUCL 33604]
MSTSTNPQQQAPLSLDTLISEITSPTSFPALAHLLKSFAPKDVRDVILGSTLSGGGDPLDVLDVVSNTLGVLWILSARVNAHPQARPRFSYIEQFCATFDVNQARLAPERVTLLARGIVNISHQMGDPKLSLKPLYDLLTRFPPNLSYLTPLHPLFVVASLQSSHLPSTQQTPITRVLSTPIKEINTNLCPDLGYNDNLVYHYVGGCCWVGSKVWVEAQEFFEIVIGAPAQAPSAIQMEAAKKLLLVQLIKDGKLSPLPKYTHPHLPRLLKQTPYHLLVKHFPLQLGELKSVVEKERDVFVADENLGLVLQVLDAAPRWAIQKLTHTYLSLGLGEIAKSVGMEGEVEEVGRILLSMIEKSEINATISIDGTVTFNDSVAGRGGVSKGEMDRALREAQYQAEVLQYLEREVGRSREYLVKAAKGRDEVWGGAPGIGDEDLMLGVGPGAAVWEGD